MWVLPGSLPAYESRNDVNRRTIETANLPVPSRWLGTGRFTDRHVRTEPTEIPASKKRLGSPVVETV